MATNKALEMAGNMFNYKNPCCDCKITTNYTDMGVEFHSLQLRTTEGYHCFAYAPIDGLVMINEKTGAIINNHKVVEDFLNINFRNAEKIKEFIDIYGFIMPLPADGKYRIFHHKDLAHLINRFKVLVKLMSAIEDENIDYDNILKLTAYLLFARPRKITLNEDDEGLCTCIHALTHFWYNIENLPDRSNYIANGYIDNQYVDYYPISDSFTKKEEALDTVAYHEDVDDVDADYDSSPRVFKAKITKLYRDAFEEDVDINARYVIDFLYHLIHIGINIDDVLDNGNMTTDMKLEDNIKFDSAFKTHLILIAKNTIKYEFDFALYGIHPTYNVETMSPNWEIPNLFTALYFALFYTRPDYEIYRVCANPNCNRLFKVKTTNSRKRYHDNSCQNAAAQMRHRKARK